MSCNKRDLVVSLKIPIVKKKKEKKRGTALQTDFLVFWPLGKKQSIFVDGANKKGLLVNTDS